jgi:hypothetical protein
VMLLPSWDLAKRSTSKETSDKLRRLRRGAVHAAAAVHAGQPAQDVRESPFKL